MKDSDNIHATCVAIGRAGVLILGKSGAGKSDLALRLIENKKAVLVSDDRTCLTFLKDKIIAKAPDILKGLLEVRGIGILKYKYIKNVEVKLVVNLVNSLTEIKRMPDEEYYAFGTVKLPMINLYPFELSSTDKVVIKLKANLEK